MIDVAALVGDLPVVAVQWELYSEPTINQYGETVDPVPVLEAREVVVHPAGRRMLERLPEADRARETIAIYDTQPIVGVGSARPEVCRYQGSRYEVTHVADYEDLAGIYLVLASRIDETQ